MDLKSAVSSLGVAISREIKIGMDLEFFFGTLFEPLIYVMLFGPLMGKLIGNVNFGGNEISYLAFMFPGVLTIIGINQGFRGAATFIQDKFRGGLETLFTLPVHRSTLFLAKILGSCLRALIAMSVISLLAALMAEGLSLTLLGILKSFLINMTLVIALASCMVYLLSKSQNPNLPLAISGILLLPMMFLSTVFYPESVFSGSRVLSLIVAVNPMTHAARLIRSFIYSTPLPASTLLISTAYLSVLAFVSLLLGIRGFSRALER
ncbi:ABC transporter permease [Thermococcus celer]|nr:ABC transporter permease [Thermococcus celer]